MAMSNMEREARLRVGTSPLLIPFAERIFKRMEYLTDEANDPDDEWWWLANVSDDEIMEECRVDNFWDRRQ